MPSFFRFLLKGNDTICGDGGSDDIYGGHHKRFGEDTGDILRGGNMDDVILGDNGEIVRELINFTSKYPWINGIQWKHYPEPFDDETIRDVRRYDDIDMKEVSRHDQK